MPAEIIEISAPRSTDDGPLQFYKFYYNLEYLKMEKKIFLWLNFVILDGKNALLIQNDIIKLII